MDQLPKVGDITVTPDPLNPKQEEIESQEKITQRREARRRKILENAKIRMEKLGVHNNLRTEDGRQNGIFEYSDPEVEPDDVRFPSNTFSNRSADLNPSAAGGGVYDPFVGEKPVKDPFIFKYRLHVLISMTLSQLLALCGLFGNAKYSVVIPTCICMAAEVFIRKPKPFSPITALIVTLLKLPSREAYIIWRLSAILYDLVFNLGLSIFCIVTLTLIHDLVAENILITLQ